MDKYRINKFYFMDGYERTAQINKDDSKLKLVVHFTEYDEYLDGNEKSLKRQEGEIIEGKIFIGFAFFIKKVSTELMHSSRKEISPDIKAVVEITKIVDEYSVYAISSIIGEEILIEFEEKVNCQVGDRILIEGSLELEME